MRHSSSWWSTGASHQMCQSLHHLLTWHWRSSFFLLFWWWIMWILLVDMSYKLYVPWFKCLYTTAYISQSRERVAMVNTSSKHFILKKSLDIGIPEKSWKIDIVLSWFAAMLLSVLVRSVKNGNLVNQGYGKIWWLTPFFERFLGNGTFIFGYERYVVYIEYEYISSQYI